jgi:hypothetical protein
LNNICRADVFPGPTQEKAMFTKLIAASVLFVGLATSAVAQTAGGRIGASGTTSAGLLTGRSVAPIIGDGHAGAVRTDPVITNSTIHNGPINFNRGGNTINRGGVNPALQTSPDCADGSGTDSSAVTGSAGMDCPQ